MPLADIKIDPWIKSLLYALATRTIVLADIFILLIFECISPVSVLLLMSLQSEILVLHVYSDSGRPYTVYNGYSTVAIGTYSNVDEPCP